MSKGSADTQTQSTAVTGGNSNFVAGSGTLSSSSLSAYAGPWYVETQTLNIDYVRVAHEQSWNNVCNATLSGLSTTHGNIQSTKLLFTYIATYDAAIVYQNFNSSSVQQPQQFSIVAASGDPNGVNYGALNASTLGPMGSIITSQPFIRRVPYTGASSQQAVSKVSEGASFAMFDQEVTITSPSTLTSSIIMVDGTDYLTDLNYWSQQFDDPVGNASRRKELNYANSNIYRIPGAYDTSKELLPLNSLIDQISLLITNEQLYNWPTATQAAGGYPALNEGLPEYSLHRHG